MTWVYRRKTKENAQPPDRPKWRRAEARACQKCFWFLPLPLPLPLWPPSSLPLFLPFFPPLGAASLPFCGATVKKRVSWAGEEASSLELVDGPLPVPTVTWREGFPFTGPCWASIYCARRENRGGRSLFFFSCIAGLVRDIVGQQLEWVKKEIKFPRKQKPTRANTPTKQQHPQKAKPGKDPGKFAN